MKTRLVAVLIIASMGLLRPVLAASYTLRTPNTQLILSAEQGQDLQLLYYGDKSATIEDLTNANANANAALPAFGTVDMVVLPALQVQHADGDLNLELVVQSVEPLPLQGESEGACITLRDKLQPVTVRVFYKAWHNVDIIETWTEIVHQEKKPIVLKRFDSGTLTIPNGDNWLLHLHGDWAAEATPTVEPITRGVKTIRNTDGARNAHLDAPEVMISLDGKPQENNGRVIGAALCWSGNYEIRVANSQSQGKCQLYAGIDPQSSEYVLAPKTVFTTPHLALTYSTEGMGGVSRAFHRWARTCGMLHNGLATRDILLNSWEGIYFDITEERIVAMMNDIASFGGELFVMDDGWFGAKYPRNNDSSSLGDWVVDTRKLPHGLKGIIDQRPMANANANANDQRLKFGLWIEPEAVNTTSELFEKHPEWALQVRGRELKLGRGGTQLVLDMSNPKVQDFVFNLVDTLLTNYPEISYIKWDANASIQNYGSPYNANANANAKANLYVDYHLGLIKTLERIRAKYPNVVMQNCASGGGRANYGLMPYFDEFWVSDNNDALQRVFIQWATSYFFPSNAMAQHIGGSPYLMTGRVTPIKFRCDVAMSGRLGMELQPAHMTDEERAQCTTAIADYKELRDVIQLGNLYRLASPYSLSQGEGRGEVSEQQVASLMYVNDTKDHAVLFAYGLTSFMKQQSRRIRLAGLDPNRTYTLTERNIRHGEQPCALHGKSFTGAYLMSVGLNIPLSTEYSHDYPSRIFELK
ncbi:MAG: alpha-galactosidase [Paludibacteraceae bacterium]|nr:alpha-galactosidase [Paludibacteraceae bacterium]